jgi:hypothetical protein
MAPYSLMQNDRFGFVRPAVDSHTLEISAMEQLLAKCGFQAVTADAAACEAFGNPEDPAKAQSIARWLQDHGITVLGFSSDLDPHDGAGRFALLLALLRRLKLLACQGGPLRALYFAGPPEACRIVRYRHREVAGVFSGDETPAETLSILGIKEKGEGR